MENGEGSMQPMNKGKSISDGSNDGNAKGKDPLLLPQANVTRIMRKGLPPGTRINDEAKDAMGKCVSKFIGYVTTKATNGASVTADDILLALKDLGFNEYVEPLDTYVNNMRLQKVSQHNFRLPRLVGAARGQDMPNQGQPQPDNGASDAESEGSS